MRRVSKYRAQPTFVGNIRFASKREARRYGELKLMELAGEIRDIERQVSFPLTCDGKPLLIRSKGYPNGRQIRYVADFVYFDVRSNKKVIEDSKGHATDVYKLKRALMEAGGHRIIET